MKDVFLGRERLWGTPSEISHHVVHHGQKGLFDVEQGVLGGLGDGCQQRLDLLMFLLVKAVWCHESVPVNESDEPRPLSVGADGGLQAEGEDGGEDDLK